MRAEFYDATWWVPGIVSGCGTWDIGTGNKTEMNWANGDFVNWCSEYVSGAHESRLRKTPFNSEEV